MFSGQTRSVVSNWNEIVGEVLRRMQRQHLHHPNDEAFADLWTELSGRSDAPANWRNPELGHGTEPTITLRANVGGVDLSFLATITTFSAPNNVTLDELQIESYLPMDEATRAFFS